MIHLRPITPEEHPAYHAFRRTLYATSKICGFIDPTTGTDIDAHDTHAQHYGWFPCSEQKASVRLIELADTTEPLPLFSILDAHRRWLTERFIKGHCMVGRRLAETSRPCFAPEHRSLCNVMRFVMGIVRCAHEQGIVNGIFDVSAHHRDFHLRMGITELEGGRSFPARVGPAVLMTYKHSKLVVFARWQPQRNIAGAIAA